MIPRLRLPFVARSTRCPLQPVRGLSAQATVGEACRESSTFVSKHVVLPVVDVASFLDQRGLTFKISGKEVIVKECPFCHDTGGKLDNLWKLYIGLEKG